jgi:hypothetical protein
MIFIDYPYFNEYVLIHFALRLSLKIISDRRPGHGQSRPNDAQSIMYNKNITLQCVRWGMVDWLKDDARAGLWGVSTA